MPNNSIISEASKPLAHLVDFFCFKGVPENNNQDDKVIILVNHGYVVGFSTKRQQPLWAAYRVAEAREDVDYERPHLFYDDTRLPEDNRIGTETFGTVNGKQYDRGHLVPNFAINTQFGRLAQMESFLMSNITPQFFKTNRGVWQTMEKRIIREYAATLEHVWVYTGPIFDDNSEKIIRDNGKEVDIPISFFTILVDPFRYPYDRINNVRFIALEIPQDAGYTALDEDLFSVKISDLEQKTNINFFPNLTANEKARVEETKWGSWQ